MKKIQYILTFLFVALFAVSCSQDMELEGEQGYLTLRVNSLVSTNEGGTRAAAPEDYAPRTLHVEIVDQSGKVVKSTDDFANDKNFQGNIKMKVGTYTIVAHSAKWDGNGSGFDTPYYYGSTTVKVLSQSLVTASVTCTQANVKLTVNYDDVFASSFKSAVTTVTSAVSGIDPLQFVMNETTKSGYIPVGNFDAKLDVVNYSDVSNTLTRKFENVKAREHYILNFKLAQDGYLGDGTGAGVKVEVDESTNTYTYTFEVPRKSAISLVTRAANTWSTFAMLSASVTAKTQSFDNAGLTMEWRVAGATDWNVIPYDALTIDAQDNVTTTLKGLTPNTSYEYRLRYINGDADVVCEPVAFTTEQQIALYNGGFENWWMDGKVAYANEQGVSFWDTSNKGAASFGGSNTTETTDADYVHSGSKAARLESKYIVIKFAAASLYTGNFIELVGTKGAKLNWGVPFASRPTALKGYMQYEPASVNRTSSSAPAGAPASGEPDQCGMYCALLSEALLVDNTDMSTFPDWENDSRVIAYGSLPLDQNVHSKGAWKEVNIPLVYNNINKKPTHLLVVFSASKYGDYFHGGEGSVLYVDDFSLEYGDTPAVK
ncbi:MAG: PCMD domain-containing protein [Bacteroidaceae bacterium]|nr:PCMD domain-containing protein [Bacteroidaceae bacterium]